jgi:hypothetical protein
MNSTRPGHESCLLSLCQVNTTASEPQCLISIMQRYEPCISVRQMASLTSAQSKKVYCLAHFKHNARQDASAGVSFNVPEQNLVQLLSAVQHIINPMLVSFPTCVHLQLLSSARCCRQRAGCFEMAPAEPGRGLGPLDHQLLA